MAKKPDKEKPEHSTADYEQFSHLEKPIRNWTRMFSILIGVLFLIALAAGVFHYLKNHKSSTKTTQTAQTTPAPTKVQTVTKTYTSPNLYLTFTYPANWTIVD